MITQNIVDEALKRCGNKTILDIRAGLGYTSVLLSDGGCGLAYTFRNDLGACCTSMEKAGKLIGMNAEEVIPWLMEDNRLKAAIGLATANAVFNTNAESYGHGNVIDEISIESSDTFGMIGEFRPILTKVRAKAKQVYVFEQKPNLGEGLYSEQQIPHLLPQCSVIVITSTSIINHTIDEILPYCANAKQVCLVGASTPLIPELFRALPITLLAGVVVTNADLLLQIVSQGGGTMSMKPAVDQVLAYVSQSASS